jgi:hypothetical protein
MIFEQDKINKFIGLMDKLDPVEAEIPRGLTLNKFIGNPLDCIIFQREKDLEDFRSEDDEKYIFSTYDQSVIETFDRFQARRIFSRLSPLFDEERVERIFRMIWNYKTLIVNRKTAEYEVYSGFDGMIVPLTSLSKSYTGSFPRKTIYL